MKALRLILKLILWPVTLALSLLISIGRFFTHFSSVLLSIVSGVLFLLGIAALILLGEPFSKVWQAFLLAWLLSPYGLPYFMGFLVELLDVANDAIKSL